MAKAKGYGKWMTGKKLSDETKLKLSKISKGKPFTGTKANWVGKKHSEETKKKMSESAKGKIISVETRKKISSAMSGDKAPNWQGGKTLENFTIRHTLDYRLWRESVFKRDDYTCQECGSRNGNGKKIVLNADHIMPFSDYPELRFDINNGRTLCVPCHRKTPTYGNYKGKYKVVDTV